ncbi:uncharacterized protein AMSG_00322 [Thecamonas trahens ATCC 50062]|uniref:Uncharacterized protein n=1 Tax=Thecamonas trahens ATCC 50062 TaxID=461836 RepID=A0A0L0D4H5_THETB|nr:hypothetical protein AMSG_00322 [Thecamonas trahens ATCC 50062]KNC46203.1 hypothetical protein AMSG_00322 [Thecamonas trahens ATCC 50062]|eukprot:XP_013763178.1 hypothetical protein AMSG_00322 [Thecamonas trahens ATCC 50062]
MADPLASVHPVQTVAETHLRAVRRQQTLQYLRELTEEEQLERELITELHRLKSSLAESVPFLSNLAGWYAGAYLVDLLVTAVLKPAWLT